MTGAATALPAGLTWEQFLELVADLDADGRLTSPQLPVLTISVGGLLER